MRVTMKWTVKQSSAPISMGKTAARSVHFQLPVSFLTVSKVVEHGQCIIIKISTHTAVVNVQSFARKSALVSANVGSVCKLVLEA